MGFTVSLIQVPVHLQAYQTPADIVGKLTFQELAQSTLAHVNFDYGSELSRTFEELFELPLQNKAGTKSYDMNDYEQAVTRLHSLDKGQHSHDAIQRFLTLIKRELDKGEHLIILWS